MPAATFISSLISVARTSSAPRKIPGKAEHVVDLIREIRTSGGYDSLPRPSPHPGKSRCRIRAGEDYRLVRHRADDILRQRSRCRYADKHIRSFDHIFQSSLLMLKVCDLRHLFAIRFSPFTSLSGIAPLRSVMITFFQSAGHQKLDNCNSCGAGAGVTIFTSSIFLSTNFSALISPASVMTAVPC